MYFKIKIDNNEIVCVIGPFDSRDSARKCLTSEENKWIVREIDANIWVMHKHVLVEERIAFGQVGSFEVVAVGFEDELNKQVQSIKFSGIEMCRQRMVEFYRS